MNPHKRRDKRLIALLAVLFLNSEVNAIIVSCVFEFDWHYFCHGKVIDDFDNPDLIGVTGMHIGNRTLKDVDAFRVVNGGLIEFPKYIKKHLPKVSRIDLGGNYISNITNAELREIPKLRDLSLWGNQLTQLDADLVEGMCYLRFLDVDFNHIKHVGYGFDFPENGVLFIQNNSCISTTVVGKREVIRIKSLFTIRCPPVGEPPYIPGPDEEEIKPIPLSPQLTKEDRIEHMYSKFLLFEERLVHLESKMATAIEIRIGEVPVGK